MLDEVSGVRNRMAVIERGGLMMMVMSRSGLVMAVRFTGSRDRNQSGQRGGGHTQDQNRATDPS